MNTTATDEAPQLLMGRAVRFDQHGGVDAFVDTFGADYLDLALELGIAPGRINRIVAYEAAARIGAKTDGARVGANAETLKQIAGLVTDGTVSVQVEATFALDDIRQAYSELTKRHSRGKIVMIP